MVALVRRLPLTNCSLWSLQRKAPNFHVVETTGLVYLGTYAFLRVVILNINKNQ